jgi:hypothetical protein
MFADDVPLVYVLRCEILVENGGTAGLFTGSERRNEQQERHERRGTNGNHR